MIVLIITALIGLILIIGVYQNEYHIPKSIIITEIIGAIITYILIGYGFNNIRFLDINHPSYSDGGISTVAILISMTGGLTLTIPISIYYLIKVLQFEQKIASKKKEKE